jgi:hypothetical protein
MRRRSRTREQPAKTRRHKTAALKRRNGPSASLGAKVTRLTRELKEARERQSATAEVLSAISRSKFELQSILQSVVDTASQLCRAGCPALDVVVSKQHDQHLSLTRRASPHTSLTACRPARLKSNLAF